MLLPHCTDEKTSSILYGGSLAPEYVLSAMQLPSVPPPGLMTTNTWLVGHAIGLVWYIAIGQQVQATCLTFSRGPQTSFFSTWAGISTLLQLQVHCPWVNPSPQQREHLVCRQGGDWKLIKLN